MLARNGAEALRNLTTTPGCKVLVLGIGLPDSDGRDVCQALRAEGQYAPVLFLTALDAVHDRVSGFHAGGDDYVSKPSPSPRSWCASTPWSNAAVRSPKRSVACVSVLSATRCVTRSVSSSSLRPSSGCWPRSRVSLLSSCGAGPWWSQAGRTERWSARTPSTPTSAGSGSSSRNRRQRLRSGSCGVRPSSPPSPWRS